jgi:hypothetical protein
VTGWVTAARPRAEELLARFGRAGVLPRRRSLLLPRRSLPELRLVRLEGAPRALLQRVPERPDWLSRPGSRPGPDKPDPGQDGSGGPAPDASAEGKLASGRQAATARRSWPPAATAALAWAVSGLGLYVLFLHMSRTVPVNSDGAANALQAWAMLHGNPLLRGWVLSDVSFYTTELPQYMLIELARGLTPDVVHVAAAMTYTLVVLLAARLAKGGATGGQGLLRAGVAAGIMIAPQHSEVMVLMLSPDHVGSTVPVMLAWLVIDRARRRWYVPIVAWALLAVALVADQVVVLTGIAPMILVGLAIAYQRVVRERGPLRSGIFGLALAAAGAGALEAAWHGLAWIRARGGFYGFPVSNRVVGFAHLGHNLLQTYQGLLLLFGADFMGRLPGLALAIAFVHLAGLALAAWGVSAAVRRFARADVAVQLMAVAAVISLAAYAFGPNAGGYLSNHEFAAVLPFGAALAGRMLADRLRRARLIPALAAVLAVYGIAAARLVALPSVPAENQPLAGWLAAHKLTYGLGGYWMADSISLDSGGTIRVLPIKARRLASPYRWEEEPGWFNPARHIANFVVLPSNGVGPPPGPGPDPPTVASVLATFGQPARAYFLTGYTVLVWGGNLLADLHWGT